MGTKTPVPTPPPNGQPAEKSPTPPVGSTDWKSEARKWEARAKANAKTAETAVKSVEERLAEMEARTAEAEVKALRSEIAGTHGIPPEDRDLFLTGTDKATLEAQAKRLSERANERRQHGNRVPREGTTKQTPAEDAVRDFTRGLFGRDD